MEQVHVTDVMVTLSLDIISLLTGETFAVVRSGDLVAIMAPQHHFVIPERIGKQQLLQLIKKLVEQLMEKPGKQSQRGTVKEELKEESGEGGDMTALQNSNGHGDTTSKDQPIPQLPEPGNKTQMSRENREIPTSSLRLKDGGTEISGISTTVEHQNGGGPQYPSDPASDPSDPAPDPASDPSSDPYYKAQQSFPCLKCGKMYSKEVSLKRHQLIHSRPFRCSQCERRFPLEEQLNQHWRSMHAGLKQDKHWCAECGKHYASKAHLVRHQETHTGVKSFCCPQCGTRFACKRYLTSHLLTHKNHKAIQCPECQKYFSSKVTLTRHLAFHRGHRFECPECGKGFARKQGLQIHVRLHTGERPYSCSECGKSFAHPTALQNHCGSHKGERPFSCPQCGRGFRWRSALNAHVRRHAEERPYACSECGKRFIWKAYLLQHLQIHTGERPYPCPECGKCFTNRQSVRAHQRRNCSKVTKEEKS